MDKLPIILTLDEEDAYKLLSSLLFAYDDLKSEYAYVVEKIIIRLLIKLKRNVLKN